MEEEDYEDEYNENEINEDNNIKEDEKTNVDLSKKPTIEYEIIQNSEIIKKRDLVISNFIECSCLNYDEAELVLVNYNWNIDKLTEEWYENTEKIKIESHIEQSAESLAKISEFFSKNKISEDICPICYTDIEKESAFSLKCNHYICKECYIEYINDKLLSEPINILNTPCPLSGCNLYLTRTIFKKCITERSMQRIFAKSVVRNFTVTNKEIKSCPNPRCNISVRVQDSIAKEIKCKCGTVFCFSCLEESHLPCDCEMAKQWREFTKDKGSGEDFQWIKDNTKKCPKCSTPIEKNQGCNHMRCNKAVGGCGFEFCWICMKSWNSHTITSINSYYKCEKITEKEFNKEKKKKNLYIPKKLQKMFEGLKLNELERYVKYYKEWYERYRNLEISDKIKEKIQESKKNLIEKKNLVENDLIFLDECLDIIIDCNRLLKYLYIFEYFLDDKVNTSLFENNLEILKNQSDSLLELIEMDKLPAIIKIDEEKKFKEMFNKYRDHISTLNHTTQLFKTNLLKEIQNDLYDQINYDRLKNLSATLVGEKRTKKKFI
jgi:ariadne-1